MTAVLTAPSKQRLTWDEIHAIQQRRQEKLAYYRETHWRPAIDPRKESLQDACFRLLEPVNPLEFWSTVFDAADDRGLLCLETPAQGSVYNGVIQKIPFVDGEFQDDDKHVRQVPITAGCFETKDVAVEASAGGERYFCLANPILYAGTHSRAKNARWLCAFAIDIDYIFQKHGYPQGLYNLLACTINGELPTPTYIVCSGHGLHAYYVLEEPIPLFARNTRTLDAIRKKLVRELWLPGHGVTDMTSMQDIQYENLNQQFRMPGTLTKQGLTASDEELAEDLRINGGRKYYANAYKIDGGQKVSIDYLISWVAKDETQYRSLYLPDEKAKTFEEMLELWPDWTRRHYYADPKSKRYRKRRSPADVLKPRGKHTGEIGWKCNEAVYNWWLNRVDEVVNGHRYHYCMCLAAYARKCGISKQKFTNDVYSVREILKGKDTKESKWTTKDEEDALKCYDLNYLYRLSVDRISAYSGLLIKKNKRNGRPRDVHLEVARATRDILCKVEGRNWRDGNGRKPKKIIVAMWRSEHPDGTKAECIRDTGLSRPTVYKWWDFNKKEKEGE